MAIRIQSALPLAAIAMMSLAPLTQPMPAYAQRSGGAQAGANSGLSPDQQARAGARQAKFQKEVAALKADATLTDAQKQDKYKTLYGAMDRDMLAILTPAQRAQVLRQRQINVQFQKDVAALQADKTMTDAQKKARYTQLVQTARDASLAIMTPTQRAAALKRVAAVQKQQQQRAVRIAEAQRLGKQLQKSETPTQSKKISSIALTTGAQIQTLIADKTLSDETKTQRINSLRQAAQAQDMAILTPSQRMLYARIQALIAPPPQ